MKTVDFIREHNACSEGAEWALSVSDDMADVWDALVEQSNHEWLLWTATWPGVFPDSILRKLACRFVRETPLHDGRTVWDLLTDERSRKAIEVAERYADGNATEAELDAAYAAALAAAATRAAASAAFSAAWAASCTAWVSALADTDADHGAAAYAANDAAYFTAVGADKVAEAARAPGAVSALYSAVADPAALSAQIKMIAQLGNPFKKES